MLHAVGVAFRNLSCLTSKHCRVLNTKVPSSPCAAAMRAAVPLLPGPLVGLVAKLGSRFREGLKYVKQLVRGVSIAGAAQLAFCAGTIWKWKLLTP